MRELAIGALYDLIKSQQAGLVPPFENGTRITTGTQCLANSSKFAAASRGCELHWTACDSGMDTMWNYYGNLFGMRGMDSIQLQEICCESIPATISIHDMFRHPRHGSCHYTS
jgi:hypothetical protein